VFPPCTCGCCRCEAAEPLACGAIGERLIQSSRLVAAVWDGSLSAGDRAGRPVAFAVTEGLVWKWCGRPGRHGPAPLPAVRLPGVQDGGDLVSAA